MKTESIRELLKPNKYSQDMPHDLKELARELDGQRKLKAEHAARELDRKVTALLVREPEGDRLDLESDGVDNVAIPLELFVVLAVDHMGQPQLRELIEEFGRACGNDPATITYGTYYFQWLKREDPADTLRRAILPILVADFEELIAGLVRVYHLSENMELPNAVKKGHKATEGPPKTWSDKVLSLVDLDVPQLLGEDWLSVFELFARRHTIIHQGGRADDKYCCYLRAQGIDPPPVGSSLVCDQSYLDSAISIFERLADLLAVTFAAKLAPGEEALADFANRAVVRALHESRWNEADLMAGLVVVGFPDDHQHHRIRINRWMAKKMLSTDDAEQQRELREEIQRWGPPPGQPDYRLAKSILLEDERAAIDALEECLNSRQLSIVELRSWPLIEFMNESSEGFRKAFEVNAHRRARNQRIRSKRNRHGRRGG
ncbi:hypothetical protein [Ferrimicrobium sp.]|uniref:hypothetical protein n=1 Tax=Ferrimicrobium sp. TaxID=2926050 RepID=UPI00261B4D39|nr:hypothetical protein [Ferrimicrobium sp.]